jgi:hypothetical protein
VQVVQGLTRTWWLLPLQMLLGSLHHNSSQKRGEQVKHCQIQAQRHMGVMSTGGAWSLGSQMPLYQLMVRGLVFLTFVMFGFHVWI